MPIAGRLLYLATVGIILYALYIDLSVILVLLLVLCGIIGAVIFWHKVKRKQSLELSGVEANRKFNPFRLGIIIDII